jgi:hypothetical protein
MKRHHYKAQSGQMLVKGFGVLSGLAGFTLMRLPQVFAESLQTTLRHAVQGAISVVLSLLSAWGLSASSISPLAKVHWRPAHSAIALAHALRRPFVDHPSVALDGNLYRYTYVFEGRAIQAGKPCSLAGVMIRIASTQGSQTKWTVTDSEGNYAVPFDIDASHYEPIRWSIEAHNGSRSTVKLMGQRIAMREDDRVMLANSLQLVMLPSNPPNPLIHEDEDLKP